MIILGDVAVPTQEHSKIVERAIKQLGSSRDNGIILNLEGLISEENHLVSNEPVLYNEPGFIEVLSHYHLKAVCLANNHTFDLVEKFDQTVATLSQFNIPFVGVSKDNSKVNEPIKLEEKGGEVFVFNYCWDFLIYHQKNPSKGVYLSLLEYEKTIQQIKNYRIQNPNARLLVYFHWSIDLETLPFPMYRKFSKQLIDVGADLVVGCHSHCVQGGEKYKEGYIVYGLGNFYIPQKTFANGKISYPQLANRELVLEWDVLTNRLQCVWFDYGFVNGNHLLKLLERNNFEDCPILPTFSPYSKMSDDDYVSYFKKNRRKKMLMPLFVDYKGLVHDFSMRLLRFRAKFARFLAKNKLLKWAR